MQQFLKWAIASGLAVAVAVGTLYMYRQQTQGSGQASAPASSASNAWAEAASGAGEGHIAAAPQIRTPEQTRNRLFKEGSLAGTEPSGDWCVGADQQLKPCEGLRTRIEYYLLALGEVSVQDIRALIEDESKRANGSALTAEIMAIFDKYWQIRIHDWKNTFNQSDRSTWLPVFEEQKAVRRQILGEPWASAFFTDDEQHFKTYYAQLESGTPPPPHPGEPVPQMEPGKDPAAVRAERVARYGEDAAERLDAVDAQWADWDRRLAAARSEWQRIQAQGNLSETQKQDEMALHVDANFKGKEQVRVKALLKLR